MTIRTFGILVSAAALAVGLSSAQQKTNRKPVPKPAAKVISFKSDVAPLLRKYCLPCHTEDQMNPSELYLDTYENVMASAKHGRSVLPGNADSSLMVRKISLTPPFGDPMPLKRKVPFPDDSLRTLKLWIQQGAKNN